MSGALFSDVPRNKRRDAVACWLCNFILVHLASEWYERMIQGCIRLGLRSAVSGSDEAAWGLFVLADQLREASRHGALLDWEVIDATLDDLDELKVARV